MGITMRFGRGKIVQMDPATVKVVLVSSFGVDVQRGVSIADGRRVELPDRREFGGTVVVEVEYREGDKQAKNESGGNCNESITSLNHPTAPIVVTHSLAARTPTRRVKPSSHSRQVEAARSASFLFNLFTPPNRVPISGR